ncbi:MAG: UDP-N-acetylmuramoyl-tripeptide--D-alanyl-D-alanine ligase [Clostridiaceae bacterium]|nr:UDP-N-acetylmuramoyl-tripeptide--D-alanyl-D-alanine ligase [Clostridiaceae bacterium]
MEPITLKEIAEATAGRLVCGDPSSTIATVSTDSRSVSQGSLFIPIVGVRFDAHAFILQALQSGAAATLSARTADASPPRDGEKGWIEVEDTLVAMQQLSAWYRSRFDIPVVGVTGSVGKTSTKEMVADALSPVFSVLRTKGNFNNEIGMPATLLCLERSHSAAVIEMGTSSPGEIPLLSTLACPTHAVVTNIGISHIEFFGSREAIREEKLGIAQGFPQGGGKLFLNGDDPLLAAMRGKTRVPTVWFGTDSWCTYRAEEVNVGEGQTTFTLVHPRGRTPVRLPVLGMHHVRNALAAAAVADDLGVDPDTAARGMRDYHGASLRQQLREGNGIHVIDDSYNASPDSVRSGLEALMAFHADGRHVAVLADMYELGSLAKAAHEEAGRLAVEHGVDMLIAIGNMSEWILAGAKESVAAGRGRDGIRLSACATLQDAYVRLTRDLARGDVVLVKGSRGIHADRLARALVEENESTLSEN